MKHRMLQTCAIVALLASGASGAGAQSNSRNEASPVISSFGTIPLFFEQNAGQLAGPTQFYSRGTGYELSLETGAATLSLYRGSEAIAIRMALIGASAEAQPTPLDRLASESHYFVGGQPEHWRAGVPHFERVVYDDVYPGIDAIFYGSARQIAYDFVLEPGADPSRIRLAFHGAERLSLDADGRLVLHLRSTELVNGAPVIYQDTEDGRVLVEGRYRLERGVIAGFDLGDYDPRLPLVIDPVLVYSTYLGGIGTEGGSSVTFDASGNTYVAGSTVSSPAFPTTVGALQTTSAGAGDAFISKISPDGTSLMYSTFYGGSGTDGGRDISVDDLGRAYVVGTTGSHDLPTVNAFDTTCGSDGLCDGIANLGDLFVLRLSADGSSLDYASYLGGNDIDVAESIIHDVAGNAYVAGRTESTDLPTTPGAFQSSLFSPQCGSCTDLMVFKLDALGQPVYGTYIGRSGKDSAADIAVDASGHVYIAGDTATDYPTTPGAFKTSPGKGECIVTKLNPTGTGLVYSTFLGGDAQNDVCGGIVVDGAGHAYVTGVATAHDFPTTPGAYDTTCGSDGLCDVAPGIGLDAFLTKLTPDGSGLVFSTFLGGSHNEYGLGVGLDGDGNVYVSGYTQSTDFPLVDPIQATIAASATCSDPGDSPPNCSDVFVTRFDPTGSSIEFSTFLGGSDSENITGSSNTFDMLEVDPAGNVYVTGRTRSSDFPTTPGVIQPTGAGGPDAFVAKIGDLGPTADAGPDQTVDEGDPVTLDGSASSPSPSSLIYSWTQIAGTIVTLSDPTAASPTFMAPYVAANETLTFQLIVDDGTTASDPDTVDVTVVDVNSPPVADAGDDSTIKEGAAATLDGSNSFDPEGDTVSYQWLQVAGPAVVLTPSDTEVGPSFVAPVSAGSTLVFKLVVSDGNESSTPSAGADSSFDDTVAIDIVFNSPPVADAGVDQTKDEGSSVTLDGTGSSDPDGGDSLSFQWSQTGGTSVLLSDATAAMPSFDAPAVSLGGEDLNFELVVTDDDTVNPLSSPADEVVIHVTNLNDPPRCDLAVPSVDTLWPPNHKMKAITIDGVSDDDAMYNDVTLTITGVTQDEPVDGLGDGDSSPDAIVQSGPSGDSVLLRAERSGTGDGRVYVVSFIADDGFESCSASVTVVVPHSRKSTAVDSGQVHDSTSN